MYTIIIPSLNPDEKLLMVVKSLINEGFSDIIVVNDGSDTKHMTPFMKLKKMKECVVLTHPVNMGKGRALKTAFTYCIVNRPDISGVITVDGDNQHRAFDIRKCARKMEEKPDSLILGVRDFSGANVPKKSKMGNNLTSFVFKFACGINISDTQTGLRGIPKKYLEDLCKVAGERFEYETNMLLIMNKMHVDFVEVPIETVYIDENATTHFHPVRDSIKIYGIIFKFLFGSISASVIDLVLFTLLKLVTVALGRNISILVSTVGARLVSSFYNFNYNRKSVFGSESGLKKSVVRYYILCVVQMMISYGLVYGISNLMTMGNAWTVVTKAVIDTLLFVVSFWVQRVWVFKK